MRIFTGSLLIVSIMLSAIILLTGCESGQLNDCQQENVKLNSEITKLNETTAKKNIEVQQLRQTISEYSQLVVDMTVLLESGKAEVERLRREVAKLKKP